MLSHDETRSANMSEYIAQANEFARVEVAFFRGLVTTSGVSPHFSKVHFLLHSLGEKHDFKLSTMSGHFHTLCFLCIKVLRLSRKELRRITSKAFMTEPVQ